MTDTPKTVWVTRYALTRGIEEALLAEFRKGRAWVRVKGARSSALSLSKNEFHLTREAAVTRANAMREAKLASLEKQAEKLRAMTF